ncbi:hypothetical protein AURDEDRAFT_158038 [Auricularia subglabra TFB-10046 SS5]|nr:hypothetical protein AURDEDRAFT_158038 [Auricularia subglabra TFB-10046 SS5]
MATAKPDVYVIPIDPAALDNNAAPFNAQALWENAGAEAKQGTTRTFFDMRDGASAITLVSIGKDLRTNRDEAIRRAVAIGVKAARDTGGKVVHVDVAGHPHAAAQGVHLGIFQFTLKTTADAKKQDPLVIPIGAAKASDGQLSWETGVLYAQVQNLARELTELPGNMCTPTYFCERVQKEFAGVANVEISVRDKEWAQSKNMNSFLSVAKGTDEPPRFLEIHYQGADASARPIVWVGKGITFDSGGISIKPSANMKLMRGDMGGAASVVSAALGVAKLKLPINLIVLTPLTENLPGPSANKPGDIIYASNGKSIEVDNTDAEGRLVLADALYYGSSTFNPHTIIDVATLTGAMVSALGAAYSGVYSSADSLWDELHAAGEAEFDKFWRMPLDDVYASQITGSNADLCNVGGAAAGPCTAAYFLKSFVNGIDEPEPKIRWAHIDNAGSMSATTPLPYQSAGMTGRPTRALLEFARRSALQEK